MDPSRYRCPGCERGPLLAGATLWVCQACRATYPTVQGVPKLYCQQDVDRRDILLRDSLYDGFLGKYYRHVMPFLTLPVRPSYWNGWLAYTALAALLLALLAHLAGWLVPFGRWPEVSPLDAAALLLSIGVVCFLLRNRYLFHLLWLAVPVKISLRFTRFRPTASFADIHARCLDELRARPERLQVLDVSTGTCNSLYRHGWMKLDAEYVGLDLSETMLLRGRELMSRRGVPMDFVLGDATRLPFESETFDAVLNYGAVNGYGDPRAALAEMARVAKPGGLVLFLDEQLYDSARWIERVYFRRVLSSHNTIHRCPVELLPPTLTDVAVHQVYHFYYLCTARKPTSTPS